jgi:hypothetical protein
MRTRPAATCAALQSADEGEREVLVRVRQQPRRWRTWVDEVDERVPPLVLVDDSSQSIGRNRDNVDVAIQLMTHAISVGRLR